MQKVFELSRDGKFVMFGTIFECMEFIHTAHCYSLNHALTQEGYSLREKL